MPNRQQALIAMPDPKGRKSVEDVLAAKGLDPLFASNLLEIRAILSRQRVAVVFCQSQLEDGGFSELLDDTAREGFRTPVVVCSPQTDSALYIDAMSRGAFDFIAYPYSRHEVEWVLECALPRAAAAGAA